MTFEKLAAQKFQFFGVNTLFLSLSASHPPFFIIFKNVFLFIQNSKSQWETDKVTLFLNKTF